MQNNLLEKRTFCPACYNNSTSLLYREKYNSPMMVDYLNDFYSQQGNMNVSCLQNYDFEVVQCLECSLIFQTNIPSENFIFDIYEDWLDPDKTFSLFEANHNSNYYVNYLQQVYQFINLFKSSPSQLKFFDFGMGWGNWLKAAQAFGCQVFGFDLSPKRTEYAKKGGITIFDPMEESNLLFDFINLDQVLEHLREPQKTLLELKNKLNPGGYIFIGVPNGNIIPALLKAPNWFASKSSTESLNAIAPIEHLNCFTTQSLLQLIESVGLEPVKVPHYPRLVSVSEPLSMDVRMQDMPSLTWRKIKNVLKPVYRYFRPVPPVAHQWTGTQFLCRIKPSESFTRF